MGGCSSKPQTAETCPEGLLFHTGLKTSDSSAHQTLESLFNQHGRDGENLLDNAQTLHELLLHAVESKELPDFENQSTGKVESNSQTRASQPHLSVSPCKLNSPISVLISHAAKKDASECMEVEGALLNLAESNAKTGPKLESSVSKQVSTEKCTQLKGSVSDLAEYNQKKGAQSEGLAMATDEECGKSEGYLPEKIAEIFIKGDGFMSNVAQENQEKARKSKGFVANLAEVKQQEECVLSKFAEENAIKLASGSLDLEPKSDLLKNPESVSSECIEYETTGLNPGFKPVLLKISELILLDSLPTDVQKIQASDSMESKEADLQGLNEIAMQGVIEREVQDEITTVETNKIDKKDMKCKKNEKALQGEKSEEQSKKAMEEKEMVNAVEDTKMEMLCAMALGNEKEKTSHKVEKAESPNEKAMEVAPPKVQFESGRISPEQGNKAMEENMSPEKTEEAMECEKEDMQDEKALESWKAGLQDEKSMREDEKAGVQNERAFDGEMEKLQRDEDEKAVHRENLADVQDEEIIGVQDDRTRVLQTKKAGLEDVKTRTQHEASAEDENAMVIESFLHVKAQHEEAMADAWPSSPGNQSFADCIPTKHNFCFEPLTGSQQSIVAMGSGPILQCASKENIIEAAELQLMKELDECNQKKPADVVANFELTEKPEVDQKKLVSDENTIEAVGPEECSIEAVAGSELAKLCNTFKGLDDGQPTVPDSEQMLHIERHGKLEQDIVGSFQHCEADELDDKKNAKATVNLIEVAIANSDDSDLLHVGEKGDDKSASELSAKEEKKAIEPSEEHTMHEGNAKAEGITIECPTKLVIEEAKGDDSDEKVKMEVFAEEHGFVQKDHDAEKLHIQMPIREIPPIISKGGECADNVSQEHSGSALCSFPESSVPENHSSPTVADVDVEKLVVDITSSSSLSAAEKSCMECVESKHKQKPTPEVIDDANETANMEASKLCGEKGEDLKGGCDN